MFLKQLVGWNQYSAVFRVNEFYQQPSSIRYSGICITRLFQALGYHQLIFADLYSSLFVHDFDLVLFSIIPALIIYPMNSKSSVEEAEQEPLYASSNEELDDIDSSTVKFSKLHSSYHNRCLFIIGSLIIATLVFVCITLALRLDELGKKLQDLQVTKCAFPTDVEDATRYIQFEEKVFTGAIAMNQTHNGFEFYQQVPDAEPQLFGDPALHPEIDANWKDLLSSGSSIYHVI
jgi:hypothetical protein